MGTLVALVVGLVFWLVAWTLGAKALDAFFVPIALIVAAAAARIAGPFVREQLGKF